MTVSLAEKLFMAVGLIDIGGIFIWLCICIHMGYTKMDVILKHVKNSPIHSALAPNGAGGPLEKLRFIGNISSLLTFSRLHIKYGTINKGDLDDFPVSLKGKLVKLQWSGIALVVLMAVLAAVAQFGFR